jgi:hypothetical protein
MKIAALFIADFAETNDRAGGLTPVVSRSAVYVAVPAAIAKRDPAIILQMKLYWAGVVGGVWACFDKTDGERRAFG